MKGTKMRHTALLLIMMAFWACSRIENPVQNTIHEKINVNISLSIAEEQGHSKSVNDPQEIVQAGDVIKNIWIIQFNGTSDDSRVLGEPVYIKDFSNFNGEISLVATDKPCKIYFVANTYEEIGEFPVDQWTTIGQLKQLKKVVADETGVFGIESEGKEHIIFSGNTTIDKLDQSTGPINGILKRNIARAIIKVVNNAQSDNLKIKSIQLCNVPSISFYTTDNSEASEIFPALNSFSKVNYSIKEWNSGANEMEYIAYLPVNKRGKTGSADEKQKNSLAPDGSTYLLVTATYGDEGYPLTYTFYLGADLINDHNIESNKSYEYTFTIKSKGDADTDSRIKDWGLVDFTDEEKYQLSNCYIINPMPNGTEKRNFRIPIKRALQFWGDGANVLYEDSDYHSLRNGAEWRCFILASDFEITDDKFRIVKGNGNSNTDKYFEFEVGPGTQGNVIIAVGHTKDNLYSVSWSWHLWITDYDPNACLEYGDGNSGQYIYAVTNGSVHRYEGTYWKNNRKAYIMDRNIGSFSPSSYPYDNIGFVYYQYGRKDPFFFSAQIYKYPNNGSKARFSAVKYEDANTNENNVNTIAYSVMNPLSFIGGKTASNDGEGSARETWTHDNKYVNSKYVWLDPQTAPSATNEGGKSIFDPCPPGFRLPDNTIWNDWKAQGKKDKTTGTITYNNEITTNVFSGNTDNILISDTYKRGFQSYLAIKGEQYWPYGDGSNIPSQVVYYPACGYLYQTSGKISNDSNSSSEWWGFVWSEDPHSSSPGLGLAHTFQPDNIVNSTNHRRARGMPVRCIRDLKWN